MKTALVILFFSSKMVFAQELVQEKFMCESLVENFCKEVYSPKNQGNYDLKYKDLNFKLRHGSTENSIFYTSYFFLEAILKNIGQLPSDIKYGFEKCGLSSQIRQTLNRKPLLKIEPTDLYKDEWAESVVVKVEDCVEQIAKDRTNKKYKNFIKRSKDDIARSESRYVNLQEEEIWSEIFSTLWKKTPEWKKIEQDFGVVRAEYVKWITEDKTTSNDLKKERLDALNTLKLVLPGTTPIISNAQGNARCGSITENAFYHRTRHEITVCAGLFNTTSVLQILAHEVGHSIGLNRRIYTSIKNSEVGKKIDQLWNMSTSKVKPLCEDWDQLRKDLYKVFSEAKNYKYEDEAFLSKFLNAKKITHLNSEQILRAANRTLDQTLRREYRSNSIFHLIKKDEILASGRILKNEAYLNPAYIFFENPEETKQFLYISPSMQFYFMLSNDYYCKSLENKNVLPDDQLLKKVLEELGSDLSVHAKFYLTYAGKYSADDSSINEGLSYDIEEDVVDNYASQVFSRILASDKDIEVRRAKYLASTSFLCNPPSYREFYPAESVVLHILSKASHSQGLDRRKKILTSDVKSVLQCQ